MALIYGYKYRCLKGPITILVKTVVDSPTRTYKLSSYGLSNGFTGP